MNSKTIAHIDMDAFFAAIEQRDNPNFRGLPVVVGADPKGGRGRGVVSTCSYEARKFGIHSAMPIARAFGLCPKALFLPVDGAKYSRVSRDIFKILYDFTPDIEPISIDEAFLDITGSYHFWKTPFETCKKIKERIKSEINLTASIGIAPVKMVAKIASDISKPNGLLEIKEENLLDFLWPLPVERLWGVGPETQKSLNAARIKTVGDLAKIPVETLRKKFGEHGAHLFDLSHGIDSREVVVEEDVKSVSNEHTFDVDTSNIEKVHEILLYLSEKVSRRLRKQDLKGKTITTKIRLEGFHTYTRALTLSERTNFADTIYQKSKSLFDEFLKKGMKVRLVGVRLSNFDDAYVQESLFTDENNVKKEKIHHALDVIKDKFGDEVIHRGGYK